MRPLAPTSGGPFAGKRACWRSTTLVRSNLARRALRAKSRRIAGPPHARCPRRAYARGRVDVFGIAVTESGDYLRAAAIAAAHDLGVLDGLATPRTLDELADAIGVRRGRHR